MVPTRELAEQVTRAVEALSAFCSNDVQALNLTQKVSDQVLRTLLDQQSPDIIVATPAGAAAHLGSSTISLDRLLYLVIDEADLGESYASFERVRLITN